MKIHELAALMGKSVSEVEAMLSAEDEIRVELKDKKEKAPIDNGAIDIV